MSSCHHHDRPMASSLKGSASARNISPLPTAPAALQTICSVSLSSLSLRTGPTCTVLNSTRVPRLHSVAMNTIFALVEHPSHKYISPCIPEQLQHTEAYTAQPFLVPTTPLQCSLQFSLPSVTLKTHNRMLQLHRSWTLTRDACSQAWDAGSASLHQYQRGGPVVKQERGDGGTGR